METRKLQDGAGHTVSELRFLSVEQVLMIDDALGSLGSYGEVRLSVRKGKLRFLVMQKSFDALQGTLEKRELGMSADGK